MRNPAGLDLGARTAAGSRAVDPRGNRPGAAERRRAWRQRRRAGAGAAPPSRRPPSIRCAACRSTWRPRATRRRWTASSYYFCCANCRARFLKEPQAYPGPAMTDAAAIRERFRERAFIVDEAFATALQIMLALEKPLLIEGPAGVGKTESAKVLAEVLGTRLIRLQCYEGLDAMAALYEWNYPRQMLHARLSEAEGSSLEEREAQIFSERFLLKRPLLEAITADRSPVLLIDEVDRADEAFEAFLLEVLAEWQVTIPELGTIRARHKPHVILTSNRTRELSDALRRRCLFLWLPYPSLAAGNRDPARARARPVGAAGAADRAPHAGAARAAAAEGARRRREPRLGAGADEPAPRSPRRAHARADARDAC